MTLDKKIIAAFSIENFKKFENTQFFNSSLNIFYDINKDLEFNFSKFNKKKNYEKCLNLYEKYLERLKEALNVHLNINKSKIFYEILFGYWLIRLINITVDINYSYDLNKVKESDLILLQKFNYKLITNYNYTHFNYLSSNYLFYNQLLSLFFSEVVCHKKCKFIKTKNIRKKIKNKKTNLIKKTIINFFNLIQNFKSKYLKTDAIVLSHLFFFPLKNKINSIKELFNSYNLFLNYFFRYGMNYYVSNKFNNSFNESEISIDLETRKSVFSFKSNDLLEKFINKSIIYTLPKECFEDFKLNNVNDYDNYKYIFNTGPHLADGKTKFSIANAISNGSKLILNQVGGSYGVVQNLISQEYDLRVANKFMTWGWIDNKNLNTFPATSRLGISLSNYYKSKSINNQDKKNILIVLANLYLPRREWGDRMQPEQFINYAKRNKILIDSFKEDLKKNTTIRPYNLNQECKIVNSFLSEYRKTEKNYYEDILSSKIIISTYNSTTYLECFSLNIPCFLFWSDDEWPLNPNNSSINDFLILKQNKILFNDPAKLSKFINSNYYDIEKWWFSSEIQSIVKNFKNKYIYSEN